MTRWLLLVFTFLVFSCSSKESSDRVADQLFESLKENQAKIVISIGGNNFYPQESIFSGQVLISDNLMSLTLTDQFEGKTIINLGGEKWYAAKPIKKAIGSEGPIETSIKMGKIVDKEKMIGEGYMLAEGEITATTFTKDKMVFRFKGKVGKYSDFQQPDKYIPAEGLIVYKKPSVSLGNITEKEAFSSSISN
ncbi:hypothetical protein MUK70_27540 [Dyadobacter chenwenxiniae]|uniref:Uncharacterized protein n=1 Tax=Dyadobacter chenwenxiniae TaxID=2906456 RepID=A0A9X1PNH9_9BACT|nr:hypothetical protein [Dyadobacter chenwenxiniae]MCF0064036.1 hypothetical protein [Dyadobacter chenwenxiniae]UON82763.1 hypothetical protein MUK70_27540 [Dyadobacter chenwenxiniae]